MPQRGWLTDQLAMPLHSHKPNSKKLRVILKQKPMTHVAEEMENQATNQPDIEPVPDFAPPSCNAITSSYE